MSSGLDTGQRIAGYEVVSELGRGGMGSVYVVRHPRLPRTDALKVLHEGFGDDPDLVARFTREGDVLASLDHPNIVTVFDRGMDDGRLWIAMEYVPGVDAGRLCSAGPVRPQIVADVISGVAAGLDFAHRRGIVHRDVKPANIVATPGGQQGRPADVKLTDFGIAGIFGETVTAPGHDPGEPGASQTVGTLRYAAPEQISGGPTDHRVDVYGLGVTAYEMLTVGLPFSATDHQSLMAAHLIADVPPASSRCPYLGERVDRVLARAMAKDPADRYATCGEFATELSAALAGVPATSTGVADAAMRPAGAPGSTAAVNGGAGGNNSGGNGAGFAGSGRDPLGDNGWERTEQIRPTPATPAREVPFSAPERRSRIPAWIPLVAAAVVAAVVGAVVAVSVGGDEQPAALAAPGAPTAAIDGDALTLSWKPVTDATSYEVRSDDGVVYSGSQTSVRQQLPLPGTHRYSVAARSADRPGSDYGAQSAPVTVDEGWGALTGLVGLMPALLPATPTAAGFGGMHCTGLEGSTDPANPVAGQMFCNGAGRNTAGLGPADSVTVAAYADRATRDKALASTLFRTPSARVTTAQRHPARVFWKNVPGGGLAYLVFDDNERAGVVITVSVTRRDGVAAKNTTMRMPV